MVITQLTQFYSEHQRLCIQADWQSVILRKVNLKFINRLLKTPK